MRAFKTMALSAAGAAIIAGAGAGSAAAAAPSSAAAVRHYEGTVVSVDSGARTFRLRDSERGTIRIKVRSSTSFERVGGFEALRSGMTGIEATVRRSSGAWIALKVERSGGGGHHGGGGGHGSDD
jgi:hypothetical protein